jgi:hypothetical protein
MTRDDLILMLRDRRVRLEDELRVLSYGRHDFGDGEDGLVEAVIRATKQQIAMLAKTIEPAAAGEL